MRRLKRLDLTPPSLAPGGAGHKKFLSFKDRHVGGEIDLKPDGGWNAPDVIAALLAMQGRICVYCGSEFKRTGDRTVEHFRPRNLYWFLAWTFGNLFLACTECQRRKADAFPIKKKRAEYDEQCDHCGDEGADYACPDKDPLDDMIDFGERGELKGIGPKAALFDTLAARLALNNTDLRAARIRKQNEVEQALERIDREGRRREILQMLRASACRSSPHSIVAVLLLRRYEQDSLLPNEAVERSLLLGDLQRRLELLPRARRATSDELRERKILCLAIALLWFLGDDSVKLQVQPFFVERAYESDVWTAVDELERGSSAAEPADPADSPAVFPRPRAETMLQHLEPRITAAVARFAQHPRAPSMAQTMDWLRQFGTERRIELATVLLERIVLFTQDQMAEMLTPVLQREIGEARVICCALGEQNDGASVQQFELTKSMKIETRSIRALDLDTVRWPDRIVLVDDTIGEGHQAEKILSGWLGVTDNPKYPRLNEASLELLKSRPITIAAALGLRRGARYAEAVARKHGLDAAVHLAEELNPAGCFRPAVIKSAPDRTEARAMAVEIGYQLMAESAAQHERSDDERRLDSLGLFGGGAQLIVLDTNTPTFSLPILWSAGTYDGRPWTPLFPYRKRR